MPSAVYSASQHPRRDGRLRRLVRGRLPGREAPTLACRGFPSAHPAHWSAFLASLEGEPPRVVCDAHRGMLQAIEERWPAAELHQCEWHLQHALRSLLRKKLRRSSSPELRELYERAEGALAGLSFRGQFTAAARELDNESANRWIAVNGPMIESQFARRPPPSKQPAEMPPTTSALEQLTRPIAAAPYPRRYALNASGPATSQR